MSNGKKDFRKVVTNPAEMFISNVGQEAEPKEEPKADEAAADNRSLKLTPPEGFKLNPMYVETRSKRYQLLLTPSLHQAIATRAKDLSVIRGEKVSVNSLINEVLEEAFLGNKE